MVIVEVLICPGFDRVCNGNVWCNDPLTCIEIESNNNNDEYNDYDIEIINSSYNSIFIRSFFRKLIFIIIYFFMF